MNITGSNGKVHRVAGTRTACKVRIRDHWKTTDEDLTCVRCGTPAPIVAPEPEPELPAPQKPPEHSTAQMLSLLGCHIVSRRGNTLTISIIPDMPHVTVEMSQSDLRDWCERRIASRARHKNKALRCSSGPGPSEFVTLHATKI